MDDMYNNENSCDSGYNSSYDNGSYDNGGGSDPYRQSNVQQQLQYQYQPPEEELEEPMTMGEWMITLLIMMIPCVSLVMMFVWAFSSSEKKSKSNYFKANLIFSAIYLVLAIILMIVLSALNLSA